MTPADLEAGIRADLRIVRPSPPRRRPVREPVVTWQDPPAEDPAAVAEVVAAVAALLSRPRLR